jgi:hypothetical protein
MDISFVFLAVMGFLMCGVVAGFFQTLAVAISRQGKRATRTSKR